MYDFLIGQAAQHIRDLISSSSRNLTDITEAVICQSASKFRSGFVGDCDNLTLSKHRIEKRGIDLNHCPIAAGSNTDAGITLKPGNTC